MEWSAGSTLHGPGSLVSGPPVILILALTGLASSLDYQAQTTYLNSLQNQSVYDKRIRPGYDTGLPTKVVVTIIINRITNINEVEMEFTVDLFLRLFWVDERLKHGMGRHVIIKDKDLLWVPDLYFRNEKRSSFHNAGSPNFVIGIYNNGSIYHSQRISVTYSCLMNVQKFPMDTQVCPIYAESYGYDANDLSLSWSSHLIFDRWVEMTDFTRGPQWMGNCSERSTYIIGIFDCLKATMTFQRRFSVYLVNTYFPSMLVVIMSWVSFWVDVGAVPARISIGLMTVLTMTTQTNSILSSLPRVAYIKALDVWMCACLVFVVGTFLESTTAIVVYHRAALKQGGRKDNEEMKQQNDVNHRPIFTTQNGTPSTTIKRGRQSKSRQKYQLTALAIDRCAKIVFPATFLLFTGTYFVVFTSPYLQL